MKKNSTVATKRKKILNEKKLTIGMDLGDQFTYYCVLDEAGEVLIEQKSWTEGPDHFGKPHECIFADSSLSFGWSTMLIRLCVSRHEILKSTRLSGSVHLADLSI